jgi:hypothetical protein
MGIRVEGMGFEGAVEYRYDGAYYRIRIGPLWVLWWEE